MYALRPQDMAPVFQKQVLSHVLLFVTLWTVTHHVPLSMGFPKQEYWSGWVAISYSRGSPQPRDETQVSCISCTGRQILYH